ncbi:hypothetical protein B0I00_1451 [Novosphingobium kunmingense]|uniref:Uncharacterized protein n=1 Tax=Novosphingobium kunmingense TaxID=1211806 RepID=A0A2N0HJU4_9SPHN|nr:hypothetical protein [Novosphingobium kunmingense]PKB19221.1 hypothetical protein B0I00_1451 [Novosphingobium kunmingense]
MRSILIPLAALALLAGCKGNAPEPAASDTTTAAADGVSMPALPTDPRATVTVPGSYASNGNILVLGADDSAVLTDAAGKETKGKWAWYSDGKRILLTADKSVFAVADGALYKLADKDAPLTGLTADQIWAKAR